MHYYYSHFSSIRHPKGIEKEKKNFELKDIESTMYFAERTTRQEHQRGRESESIRCPVNKSFLAS
jgi:hypothetical protein